MPRDGRDHELRAEAPGFQAEVRRVRLDADTALELTLERVVKPKPAKVAAPEAAVAAEQEASRARAAAARQAEAAREAAGSGAPLVTAVSCDPPYFIGPDGLKHYRRECL